MKRERKIHYGWIIILASFLIMGLSWSLSFNIPYLFITTLSEDLSASRTAINFSFTLRSICQLIVSVLAARAYKRFGLHRVMKFFALVLFASIFFFSRIESIYGFYLFSVLIFLSNFFLTLIPLSIIINNWFNEKTGQATGLAFMGSGIFSSILSPVLGEIMARYSWRLCYIFLAVLVLIIIIPAVFLLIKEDPESVGMRAYGKEEDESPKDEGRLLEEVKKEKSFWILLFATILTNMAVDGLMPNITPHLENLDFNLLFASRIFSLVTLSLAISQVLLGRNFDKRGVRSGCVNASLGLCMGLASLGLIRKSNLLFISLIIGTGYGVAITTVGNQNLTKGMYGNKDYANILSYFQIATSIGAMITPIIVGRLYDFSGSYLPSIVLSFVAGILSVLIYFKVLPAKDKY